MSAQEHIRVLIVDDHTIVREGLMILLQVQPDIEPVGAASNGDQAFGLCAQLQPDVVLMDLVMPEMDGPTAIRQICQDYPDIQIIALTSMGQPDMVKEAIQAGAIGYLLKTVSSYELIQAIRSASRGQPTLALEATRALIQTTVNPHPVGHDLTVREHEVLDLIAKGLSNIEIANFLGISPSTVRNHLSNIFSKLNVTNRTEATSLALRHHIVQMD